MLNKILSNPLFLYILTVLLFPLYICRPEVIRPGPQLITICKMSNLFIYSVDYGLYGSTLEKSTAIFLNILLVLPILIVFYLFKKYVYRKYSLTNPFFLWIIIATVFWVIYFLISKLSWLFSAVIISF